MRIEQELKPGDRVGRLTLLEETKYSCRSRKNDRAFLCRCDCGNEKVVTRQSLLCGSTNSCGCLRYRENIVGRKYGALTVIGLTKERNKNGDAMWECLCDCGKKILKPKTGLTIVNYPSCGCLKNIMEKPGYKSWATMIQRCYNPNDPAYKYYGARGIKVCDRWKNGFANFYLDMGDRPPGRTLDRIDANGDYTPENCRWANMETQCTNKRNTRYLTYNGERITWFAFAKRHGIKYYLFVSHMKAGLDIETTLKYGNTLLKRRRK